MESGTPTLLVTRRGRHTGHSHFNQLALSWKVSTIVGNTANEGCNFVILRRVERQTGIGESRVMYTQRNQRLHVFVSLEVEDIQDTHTSTNTRHRIYWVLQSRIPRMRGTTVILRWVDRQTGIGESRVRYTQRNQRLHVLVCELQNNVHMTDCRVAHTPYTGWFDCTREKLLNGNTRQACCTHLWPWGWSKKLGATRLRRRDTVVSPGKKHPKWQERRVTLERRHTRISMTLFLLVTLAERLKFRPVLCWLPVLLFTEVSCFRASTVPRDPQWSRGGGREASSRRRWNGCRQVFVYELLLSSWKRLHIWY